MSVTYAIHNEDICGAKISLLLTLHSMVNIVINCQKSIRDIRNAFPGQSWFTYIISNLKKINLKHVLFYYLSCNDIKTFFSYFQVRLHSTLNIHSGLFGMVNILNGKSMKTMKFIMGRKWHPTLRLLNSISRDLVCMCLKR